MDRNESKFEAKLKEVLDKHGINSHEDYLRFKEDQQIKRLEERKKQVLTKVISFSFDCIVMTALFTMVWVLGSLSWAVVVLLALYLLKK